MKNTITNIILFQLGWFACVLTAANSQPLFGVLLSAVIIFFHMGMSENYMQESRIIVIAMITGLIWDSLIVSAGWLSYKSGMIVDFMAPYWIIAMWGLFATTLNSSLSWLKDKLLLASLFGAISGPLAYYAGAKLGAVDFINSIHALIALSLGWALFTPMLLKISTIYETRETGIAGELA